MNEEITVESALEELRVMFPLQHVYIDRNDYASAEPKKPSHVQRKVKLMIAGRRTRHGIAAPDIFTDTTLAEAMAQVRAWKAQQAS